jgi:hypothetical protein
MMKNNRSIRLVKITNKCLLASSTNDHTMYDWIVDSCATKHMTFEQEWFTAYDTLLSPLLDPLEDQIMLNCGKLELEGRSQLPTLKGGRRAC